MKHINALFGENGQNMFVKVGGAYTYHCALKRKGAQ
jgi:hypothetical protein